MELIVLCQGLLNLYLDLQSGKVVINELYIPTIFLVDHNNTAALHSTVLTNLRVFTGGASWDVA